MSGFLHFMIVVRGSKILIPNHHSTVAGSIS